MEIFLYRSPSGRSPIEDFIRGLSWDDEARFTDIHNGIKAYGLSYERVQFKPLEGKLWEIKFKAKGGGYRIAYALMERKQMVWLHAFKKASQKTPKQDLELARKRLKEVLG